MTAKQIFFKDLDSKIVKFPWIRNPLSQKIQEAAYNTYRGPAYKKALPLA